MVAERKNMKEQTAKREELIDAEDAGFTYTETDGTFRKGQ